MTSSNEEKNIKTSSFSDKNNFFEDKACSNIALIKYMGKKKGLLNSPINSSFSLNLKNLNTKVIIKENFENQDVWKPFPENFKESEFNKTKSISQEGKKRFLNHFSRLKEYFSIKNFYTIYSGNNFYSDCGLASSASSFAALTKCTYKVALSQNAKQESLQKLATLSSQGSGSSSRSFFSPATLWRVSESEELNIRSVNIGFEYSHCVLIADYQKKKITSSEAHQRVLASPFIKGREKRAENRLEDLLKSFKKGSWDQSCDIVWDEFIDMHNLFYTSNPSFSYMNDQTKQILSSLTDQRKVLRDGPLVTLDAGANIHLIFREDQEKIKDKYLVKLSKQIEVIS